MKLFRAIIRGMCSPCFLGMHHLCRGSGCTCCG